MNQRPMVTSPEDTIMAYLQTHKTIKNAKAREITYTKTDFRMKSIFNRMSKAGLIEKVHGTRTSATAWCKKKKPDKPALKFEQKTF